MNAAVDAPVERPLERHSVPRALLIAGLLAGAALAAIGLIGRRPDDALPSRVVATVNQRPILRDAWLRAVAAVASERSRELTAEDQRRILDRLIDEELLVQQGLALGLAEQDGRIRSELVQQVMRSATASRSSEPDEAALRTFYEANRDFFAAPARLRVAVWRERSDGARAPYSPEVPDALLPPSTLRNYLGPALTQSALALEPGERLSLPAREARAETADAGDRVVVELREARRGAAPPFEHVRDQVRAELRRRADEAVVRELLAQLRKSGHVVIATELAR